MRPAPCERHRVKVTGNHPTSARSVWHASIVVLASALVAMLGLLPTPASAITRSTVIARAHTWVKKRVHYSQSSYFQGYRRDCSGFVSMAWKVGRSYTSSTIQHVARRVSISKLKSGDAVHTSGHVAIFVKWASKKHHRYVAMEESTWGKPALRRVRSLGRGATALRYRKISAPKTAAPKPPVPAPSPGATPGADATGSIVPTPPVAATATITSTVTLVPVDISLVELRPKTASLRAFGLPAMARLVLVPFYA
jgi:hypothetical protein